MFNAIVSLSSNGVYIETIDKVRLPHVTLLVFLPPAPTVELTKLCQSIRLVEHLPFRANLRPLSPRAICPLAFKSLSDSRRAQNVQGRGTVVDRRPR